MKELQKMKLRARFDTLWKKAPLNDNIGDHISKGDVQKMSVAKLKEAIEAERSMFNKLDEPLYEANLREPAKQQAKYANRMKFYNDVIALLEEAELDSLELLLAE